MLAVFLGLASSVKAQQLTVEYLVKANVNSPSFMAGAGLPDEVRSMYANAMKDFEMKFVLRYNDGESEFANVPMDKPQSVTIMGQTIDGKTLEEQYKGNITYKNRKKNVFVQRNNFMGKVILVKDSLDADTFEVVSGEEKQILGYECKKAVSKKGSSGKWSDRVVSMLPDEEGKQPKQQVQRITTLRGDKRRYASNKPSARETT